MTNQSKLLNINNFLGVMQSWLKSQHNKDRLLPYRDKDVEPQLAQALLFFIEYEWIDRIQ
ncbi:MAG: hypothetical protein C0417_00870 [Chlorobiaceae bacterium]|nr:hypothetical protein [Chlorobiaceae bacterium]